MTFRDAVYDHSEESIKSFNAWEKAWRAEAADKAAKPLPPMPDGPDFSQDDKYLFIGGNDTVEFTSLYAD